MSCTLTVRPGRNVWVMARTDRDAVSHEEAIQTTANAVRRFLLPITPFGQREAFEHLLQFEPKDPRAEARYIIGAARPVEMAAVQGRFGDEIPAMKVPPNCLDHRRREECDVLFGLRGERPWFILIAFDWRAPTGVIQWPRRAVNLLGFPFDTDTENDFVLLEACFLGEAQEPDTDVLEQASDATKKALADLAEDFGRQLQSMAWTTGAIVLGGVLLYAVARRVSERRPPRQELAA